MREKERGKSRREEHTEATRQALVDAGRDIFAAEGFQAAAMEAISRVARVTRGAFYHHFEDKRALFDAVVVALQAEVAAKVEARAKAETKLWDRLGAGLDTYLDACLDPAYRRIVIQEAAAVLGAQRYREIEEANTLSLLTANLNALARRGELVFDDIPLLSRMIDAMICEVALMLPDTADATRLRQNAHAVIDGVLSKFRSGAT